MSKESTPATSEHPEVQEQITITWYERETLPARWPRLSRSLEGLIRSIPSYKSTRRQRRNVVQIRVALLVLGIAMVIVGHPWMRIIGVVLAALSLVIPIPDKRRSTWITRARALRKPRDVYRSHQATLYLDERQIEVRMGEKLCRRASLKSGRFIAEDFDFEGQEGISVRAQNTRAKEALYLLDAVPSRPSKMQVDAWAVIPSDLLKDLRQRWRNE